MTPTISHISTTPFRLPLHAPLQWGKNYRMDEIRHLLVRVRLSDGAEGVAEALPRLMIYGETLTTMRHIIHEEIAPRLLGQPVTAYFARFQGIQYNYAAKAGVDMAVQAAWAQSKGVSVAAHLGCTPTPLRVSYILGIGSPSEVLEDAQRVVAQGVRVLKVKVGRDWEADLRQIVLLQEALGAGVALYADANECFTPENVAYRLGVLQERGLLYCEEPLPIELVRERTAVASTPQHLPIIADDSCFTPRDLTRELALNSFDILNIKPARTGYTASLAMLGQAQAAGKGVMVGSQAGAALGAVQAGFIAAQNGVEHPSELGFFLKLREDIVTHRPEIRDGYVSLAELTAVQLDETLVKSAEC
jgi:L-Ala-D/L-Glu epimerase